MSRRKEFKYRQVGEFANVFEATNFLKAGPIQTKIYPKFFKLDQPLVLELGCGYGEYTTSLAKIFPQKNFIGVDIKGDRLWKGASFALENKLTNVAFLRSDIKQIASFIKDNSVSQIWITFPDPQPTKPRKRLIYKDFLDIYASLLESNGQLFLKTDSKELFDFALDQIANHPKFKLVNFSHDLYGSSLENKAFDVQTRYEKKFSAMGFKICFLEAIKSF